MSPDFIGAFMIGLVGAGHCMGMCGGIASLLSMGAPNNKPSSSIPLFYNFGRLASYALIGAMVGGAISGLSELSGLTQSLAWLRFVAALFMILVALYIAKWWQGLLVVEKAGQYIWKFISPAGQRLLPLKHPSHAFPLVCLGLAAMRIGLFSAHLVCRFGQRIEWRINHASIWAGDSTFDARDWVWREAFSEPEKIVNI